MKHSYLLFLFFFGIFSSQQLKVTDSENGKAISNARIILQNQILYTNEDGFAPIPENSENFEVSASGFEKQIFKTFNSVINLKPKFKDLEEVKIISIDIKPIFEDVFKNFHKRYYDDPSLYNITIKQKSFDNDKLHFMVIAEAKLWTKNNMYNMKEGFKRNYDEILQMQLNKVKYLKNLKSDSIFNQKSDEFAHETIGNYFFSFELYRTLQHLRNKTAKFSGNLISDDGEEQIISCKINSSYGINIIGEFKYNKKDKVITDYEFTYLQGEFPTLKKISNTGQEYSKKLGDATIKYEFYKKDNTYLPSFHSINTDKFMLIYGNDVHEKKATREIIYNTFSKSDRIKLDSKVDFSKDIWENIPVKDEKASAILLSKEEQEFINQK